MSFPKMKLGECAEIHSGSTPRTNNPDFWDGEITWVTPKDLSKLKSKFISKTESKITQLGFDSCSTKLLPENSVLFSSRAPIGHVAINTIPMCTNQGFKSFVPKADLLDSQYLYYWLKANKEYLQDLGVGATFKEISKTVIANVEIPLPPLAEQRRIASILDQADTLRQKRQQAIENLDQLLQTTFIDMFGDPVDNLKGLETVALLDLCKKVTDGTHQSPKWTTEGIPFLFISNIVDGEIDYSSQKFIDQVTYDSLTKSTKIELNDILYTTVGSYGNVARVKSDQLFCFQRHIAHIKPSFDKVNPKFLEKMLSSYGVRRQADRLVRGVAQKTLNLKDLKEIIVFNIPLVEQNHFVQKCEVIESLKIKSKLALNQADDLFKSLQNQAFNGTSDRKSVV